MTRRAVCASALVAFAALHGAVGCGRGPEPTDRPRGSETAAGSPRTGASEAAAAASSEGPAPARPAGPLRVELDLAARLVLRVVERDPHLDALRIDARTIRVEARTADVSALEALCASEPSHCEDAIDAWAARLAHPIDAATDASLAMILVPHEEVRAARASALEAGLPEPIVGRAWTAPFFLALVVVEPDVLRQLEPADLVALGRRDVPALEAIALENLEREFLAPDARAFEHEAASSEHAPSVRIIRGDDGLSTSRLLLLHRWRPLTAPGGSLVAAAPTAHSLLFTTSDEPLDLATLAYLARRMFDAESAPVSPAILRLGEEGWTLESANDRPDSARDAALEAAYGSSGE